MNMEFESSSLRIYHPETDVDYTSGFGSFDLFPYHFEPVPRYVYAQSFDPMQDQSEDNEVPGNAFPFFRLPLKIRDYIYRILLIRLYPGRHCDLHPDAIGEGIRFKIGDGRYRTHYPEVHYPIFVAGSPSTRNIDQRGNQGEPPRQVDLLSIYQAIESSVEGQEPSGWSSSREVATQLLELPDDQDSDLDGSHGSESNSSNSHFSVASDPWQPVECSDEVHENTYMLDDCMCEYRTPSDYRFIRNLSQVSPKMTRELGALLWHNATLEFEDAEVAFLFAKQRPATLMCIRGIIVHVKCHGDAFDTLTPLLSGALDLVTELRFLTIRLSTVLTVRQPSSKWVHNYAAARERVKEWKTIFFRLNVREGFDVRVERYLYPWEETIEESDIVLLEGELRALWNPFVLHQQEVDI
ncbi:hypothetical protein GQ53DRAFT_811761 [Thozetella sp. PMI_491]|nr:hypothetical protein GQ53DRAFT_811761 [Thozetella sp. PMI_491]